MKCVGVSLSAPCIILGEGTGTRAVWNVDNTVGVRFPSNGAVKLANKLVLDLSVSREVDGNYTIELAAD